MNNESNQDKLRHTLGEIPAEISSLATTQGGTDLKAEVCVRY